MLFGKVFTFIQCCLIIQNMSDDTLMLVSPALRGLAPTELWAIFNEIRKVPRASGKEEQIAKWLINWAKDCEFTVKQDKAGNICIHVPATTGFEKAPVVCIQNHKDMVCVKEANKEFDFDKDPIQLSRGEEYITAQGTTLGADNGIGLSAALAIAVDPEVDHPPLEILITCEEETTFKGALGLDVKALDMKADILLNFDFEDLGEICVGSAGMEAITGILNFKREVLDEEEAESLAFLELSLTGFLGGHSGVEIDKDRGNAIITLAGMIKELHPDLRLLSFAGGQAINAIPAEAKAIVAYDYTKHTLADIKARLVNSESFSDEFAKRPDINFELNVLDSSQLEAALIPEAQGFNLLQSITSLADGVIAMHKKIPGLVETSSNLGILETDADSVRLRVAMRSNVNKRLQDIAKAAESLLENNGFKVEHAKTTPAWEGDIKAKIIDLIAKAHEEVTGNKANVMTVHAGLEVGPITQKLEEALGKKVQSVSYGPDIINAHTPKEAVHIESTRLFYEEIKLVLSRLHPEYKEPETVKE